MYIFDYMCNFINADEGSSPVRATTDITWTVYGKIKEIKRFNTSSKPDIEFNYDATGNRVSKVVKTKASPGVLNPSTSWEYTFYGRDAQGNTMATYKMAPSTSNNLTLIEQPLYGSSRLGLLSRNENMQTTFVPGDVFERESGNKNFELNNHLGNVMTVVSDRKLAVDDGVYNTSGIKTGGPDGFVDYYTPDILAANDYYAFGMVMNNRKFTGSSGSYRYGFNGKENDLETNNGSTYDYGFRIYNPNLSRFLSVDPLSRSYPWNSTYAYAENRPVDGVDLDGLEFLKRTNAYIQFSQAYGGVALKYENFNESQKETWKAISQNGQNWDGNIGASLLVSKLTILDPEKKNNIEDIEAPSTSSQTNVRPDIKNTERNITRNRPRYQKNTLGSFNNYSGGQKTLNVVTIFMAAYDLAKYSKETYDAMNWGDVMQGSFQQGGFAKRTVKIVQDAINANFIKPSEQTNENIYAIMNYILQGDAFGNKQAEEIAKKLIEIYSVPVQPSDPKVGGPLAVPTSGATPNSDQTSDTKQETSVEPKKIKN